MNEPINWNVIASIAVPIIVAALGTWGYIASHRTQKGTPEHEMINQLQEQLDADRKDRKEAEAAMRADIAELKKEQKRSQRRELIRDGYISQLRHHIDTNQGPPAPPWPQELYAD